MNRILRPSIVFSLAFLFFLASLVSVSQAQYYYKDLLTLKLTHDTWKIFHDNGVRSVRIKSFEGDGRPSEGFDCQQDISSDDQQITTHTRSDQTTESWLTAWYSAGGLLQRTLDTSDRFQSSTEYTYNEKGLITGILNTSLETDNQLKDIELHQWQYDAQSNPSGLLKIKNGRDTSFIHFIKDEKGHIAEEHATRSGQDLPVIYYYWDAAGRLTDIVRYDMRAQRLLPQNIFEYDDRSRMISQIIVPEGSNEYQKWIYEYNEKGLKTRESCYTKRKELVGRIEYEYTFN